MNMLENLLNWKYTQKIITVVIIVNAIVLGILTDKTLSADEISCLEAIDRLCLVIFVIELIAKLAVYKKSFFKESWNIFDFVVVVSSIIFISSSISVIRAFRIFRILKAIAEFPELQILVSAMLKTIPSMTWSLVLMFIIFYIFAVFGSTMYGDAFPDLFGNVGASMFTLFQVMTFESWATAVARPIMEDHGFAWIFFLAFILLTSITVLNVMVGIVVDAVSTVSEAARQKKELENDSHSDDDINQEIELHLKEIEKLLALKKSHQE